MRNLLNKFLFDKKKTLLALEYGIVFAEVAMEQKIEINLELIEKFEKMIVGEFSTKSPTRLAVDMIPNIMSVFELKLNE